jgi:hypothetical protein
MWRKVAIPCVGVVVLALAISFVTAYKGYSVKQATIPVIQVPVSSTTVALQLSSSVPAEALAVNISGLVPGGSDQRTVNVANTGTMAIRQVDMQVSVSPANSPLLAIGGVDIGVSGGGGVLPSASKSIANYTTATPVSKSILPHHYVTITITTSLPKTASNTDQGQTLHIKYIFIGIGV